MEKIENEKWEIEDALVGESIDDAEEILSQFGEVSFDDEKIDDGCDEGEEDGYVMMRSYDVGDYYVRIYYGDCTREIGCVDVN